jgi:thymidylate kinase
MAQPKSKKKSSTRKKRGYLIVFEGPDGVGKSTIAAGVANALKIAGAQSRLLSFPGREPGTLGKLIYSLHHDLAAHDIVELSSTARQALHVAAHIDVMERVILPALRAGEHVVLDRYWWSTFVYGQSAGVAAGTLDALIEPERRLWGDQPTLIFLVDREDPIDRDEEAKYWRKLRKLYDVFATREEARSAVIRLPNRSNVESAVRQALDELVRRKIVKAASAPRQAGKRPEKAAQLSIEFTPDQPRAKNSASPPSLTILSRMAPAKPTIVLDSYWRFAAERQDVFFRRLEGARRPWTNDPIIAAHKFTNAYRASDRVSQFLIRHVIYRADLPQTANEVCFRIVLFKLFNKIETWRLLEESVGPITYEEFNYKRYD